MRVDRECADIERKRVAAENERRGEERRGWLVGHQKQKQRFYHPGREATADPLE